MDEGAPDRRRTSAHVLLDPGDGSLDLDVVLLPDDVEHHLRRVLRARDGDVVSVTDGGGRWRLGRVRASSASFSIEADGEVRTEAGRDEFTLASAIPKGDRIDWLVQKCTELGASTITLVDAERSVVRWTPERADKQRTRLARVADEAVRQSRGVWRTSVVGPVPAVDVLAGATIAEPGGEPVRGDEAMIAIGPEGGWTEAETSLASTRVGLGDNILRVETAAVAATALRMVEHHVASAFRGVRK